MSKTLIALFSAALLSMGAAHAQTAAPAAKPAAAATAATPATPAAAAKPATPATPATAAMPAKKEEAKKCDPKTDKTCKEEAKKS